MRRSGSGLWRPAPPPILGHGIGSGLNERIEQRADFMSFLHDQLGMTGPVN